MTLSLIIPIAAFAAAAGIGARKCLYVPLVLLAIPARSRHGPRLDCSGLARSPLRRQRPPHRLQHRHRNFSRWLIHRHPSQSAELRRVLAASYPRWPRPHRGIPYPTHRRRYGTRTGVRSEACRPGQRLTPSSRAADWGPGCSGGIRCSLRLVAGVSTLTVEADISRTQMHDTAGVTAANVRCMTIAAPTECLFCGVELSASNRTKEHVFPRWLQQRYGIAKCELELLNGTAARYEQLLVPACRECNNIHAGQLEARVAEGTASSQDMWLWMLKIHLGLLYWESGKPMTQDRRKPESAQPVFPLESLGLGYFQSLFSALKGSGATFNPDPLGTILSFPDQTDEFDYADRHYQHPRVPGAIYSAGLLAFDSRVWIALFDDGHRVADHFIDEAVMQHIVADGRDPRRFFPELMYARSRIEWYPKVLVSRGRDGHTNQVVALPTLTPPNILPYDVADLMTFVSGRRLSGDD